MIKVFAIGNTLMKDDGIADYVLRKIKDDLLKMDSKINIIFGETDFMYCVNLIEEKDTVIIIDGCMLGYKPGIVTLTTNEDFQKQSYSSSHQLSLPGLINTYKKNIKLFVIGIEIYDIDYGTKLSSVLNKRFNKICEDVLSQLEKIIKEEKNNA